MPIFLFESVLSVKLFNSLCLKCLDLLFWRIIVYLNLFIYFIQYAVDLSLRSGRKYVNWGEIFYDWDVMSQNLIFGCFFFLFFLFFLLLRLFPIRFRFFRNQYSTTAFNLFVPIFSLELDFRKINFLLLFILRVGFPWLQKTTVVS